LTSFPPASAIEIVVLMVASDFVCGHFSIHHDREHDREFSHVMIDLVVMAVNCGELLDIGRFLGHVELPDIDLDFRGHHQNPISVASDFWTDFDWYYYASPGVMTMSCDRDHLDDYFAWPLTTTMRNAGANYELVVSETCFSLLILFWLHTTTF
jgi:hypothetical protein